MFKKQINIVESNSKPNNKHDWWFDTKNNKLKRYSNGVWKTISSGASEEGGKEEEPEFPEETEVIKMPPANEVWILNDSDGWGSMDMEWIEDKFRYFGDSDLHVVDVEYDPEYYTEKDVWGDEEEGEYDEWPYELVKIIFNEDLPESLVFHDMEGLHSQDMEGWIWIKFPNHITSIESNRGIIPQYPDTEYYFFGENVDELLGHLFESVDEDLEVNIICLAPNPPLMEESNSLNNVYVLPESINKYKSATNWSRANIMSINSLPEIYKA